MVACARPALRACFAYRFLPVSIRSSAATRPIRSGKRTVPPRPGSSPSMTSGSPKRVLGLVDANTYRAANASSVPPPRQAPSTAATNGLRQRSMRSSSAFPWRMAATTSAGSR
jgi:hypothetical protein